MYIFSWEFVWLGSSDQSTIDCTYPSFRRKSTHANIDDILLRRATKRKELFWKKKTNFVKNHKLKNKENLITAS